MNDAANYSTTGIAACRPAPPAEPACAAPSRHRWMLGLMLCALLSACAVLSEGTPVAGRKVKAEAGIDVETGVADVFCRQGFRLVSSTGLMLVFERPASKADEVLYGNWGSSKSLERVVVRIKPAAMPNEYHISCQPFTVRDPGSGMEDVTRRFEAFSREYSALLKEVDVRLKELAELSRAEAAREKAAGPGSASVAPER